MSTTIAITNKVDDLIDTKNGDLRVKAKKGLSIAFLFQPYLMKNSLNVLKNLINIWGMKVSQIMKEKACDLKKVVRSALASFKKYH